MYIGSQWRIHRPYNRTRRYQSDRSGSVEYIFDNEGYRITPTESNPNFRFYTSGCSLTFGVGLAESDTWPAVMARRLRRLSGLRITYRNFAQGGASNDYIVRSLIAESELLKPDLIVAHFTYKNRTELNGGTVPGQMIGPWCTDDNALHYYAHYSDQDGVISSLKNMLLLQLYCRANGIRFVYSSEDDHITPTHSSRTNGPVASAFFRIVSSSGFVGSRLWTTKVWDRASDGWHPGPSAHLQHGAEVANVVRRIIAANCM